ncbi:MAG: zinc-dependent metalloprotease, partial [Thermomicrobiaceae bacterium]|nr:zinc-dependent metalloprotease [Thermomicrobiaceae bacterium]
MERTRKPDKRLLAAGLLLGAAVGAWAGQRTREYAERREVPNLINWDHARSIAIGMNREGALSAERRAELDRYYAELIERAIPLVAAYTGDELSPSREHVYAFDRVDWIGANIDNFRRMFEPLEALNPLRGQASPNPASVLWGSVNQTVLSAEIGLLLGYLARRVLGQYDLPLLGREPLEAGKLYFVQPNIESVERALNLPGDDFRLWLALHETTHAFEFEAHPWLRQHVNGLLETYFDYLRDDVERLTQGFRGLRAFWERARSGERGNGSWLEMVMTPEQRRLFNTMQATMSVVEGYSNHVMNAVGRELIPTYETISRRFERRQQQRTVAEQLFARLTGLDLKLEQYRQGEAFINQVVRERGHDVARRIWEGPEM